MSFVEGDVNRERIIAQLTKERYAGYSSGVIGTIPFSPQETNGIQQTIGAQKETTVRTSATETRSR